MRNSYLTPFNGLGIIVSTIKTFAIRGRLFLLSKMAKFNFNLLSLNEVSFLVRLLNKIETKDMPARTGFADSQSDGRIAATLSQKGIIQPFGKVEGKIRWQVVMDMISPSDIELLNRMNHSWERTDLYRD